MKISLFLLFVCLYLNTLQAQETGNVGIGTTNPTQKLDVNGSIGLPVTINSSTGIIFKEGISFLHDFKASSSGSIGQNVFLGKNAGNFTMPGGANYLSSDNTGVGTSTLYSLTTGYANTAVGSFALNGVQSGVQNSAVGLYGLLKTSSGSKNSTLGAYASNENTFGDGNVSIGFEANYHNQTGSYNTIIGFRAGKGSSLHNKSYNVFIGNNAGYFETGSNKLYIENSNSTTPLIGGDFSLDQVYLNGAVGIGTSTPAASAKLEIAGTDKGFLPPRLSIGQISALANPVAGLMVYNTYTNKPNYYDGTRWRDFNGNIGTPQIGDQWEGGIVYYIDGTGEHGLISAESDQGTYQTWGCMWTFLGATYNGFGAGETNTAIIVNNCSETANGATLCNDLLLNNYSDWYLPSAWEMAQIFASGAGVGGFTPNLYWTSTEIDFELANVIAYPSGNPGGFDKFAPLYTRCIRKF